MIIVTGYPYYRKDILDRRTRSEVISSLIYNNREKIDLCHVELHYNKKLNSKLYPNHQCPTVRRKRYYTNEELVLIYTEIMKYCMPNTKISGFTIIEDEPASYPDVKLIIRKLS